VSATDRVGHWVLNNLGFPADLPPADVDAVIEALACSSLGDALSTVGAAVQDAGAAADARERATCSTCLARTYRGALCSCEDGGDAEDYDEIIDGLEAKARGQAADSTHTPESRPASSPDLRDVAQRVADVLEDADEDLRDASQALLTHHAPSSDAEPVVLMVADSGFVVEPAPDADQGPAR
jgi:hypothetical protein